LSALVDRLGLQTPSESAAMIREDRAHDPELVTIDVELGRVAHA
jgi:hypothetical protein